MERIGTKSAVRRVRSPAVTILNAPERREVVQAVDKALDVLTEGDHRHDTILLCLGLLHFLRRDRPTHQTAIDLLTDAQARVQNPERT